MLKKIFTREVKIGILVVTSIALLLFGLNFLKGINILKPTNYYYANFEDIDGLVETSGVFIKGHRVGQVSNIEYDFTKKACFILTLDVNKDLKFPEGTRAELFDNGMIGGKAIRIAYAEDHNEYIALGDTLESKSIKGFMKYLSDDLVPKIDSLVTSTDSLIKAVKMIAEGEQINNSLNSIENMSANLEESSANLNSVMKQEMPRIIGKVNTITSDLSVVSKNLKGVDFAKTVTNIDSTMANLNAITQKMNSKEGSLGLLINDKSFYENLNKTSSNANQLVIDLKEHPKRYVNFSIFGGKK